MHHGFRIGDTLIFKHIFDQIDPSARTIKFIAQDLIGRAGCRAHAAMNAAAQNFIGLHQLGIFELI
jgi:hypothetical protein